MTRPRPAHARAARRGFTLIELLVVISVIMLLAALTMPALMQAIAQSERARCASNLKQIGNALILYDTQYRGYMPANRPPHPADRGDDDLSPLVTGAYCGDPGVYACPSTEDRPKTHEDIRFKRSQKMPDGRWGQLSYEYCGELNPGTRFAARGINTRFAWLAHDDDGKNVNTAIDGDNHGTAGANMLFLDIRVEWFPAQGWSAVVWRGHNGVDGEWERAGAHQ